MNKETAEQLTATADRLASAAEALNRVLDRLDAQQESLNAKVDRIVAAVEEQRNDPHANDAGVAALQARVAELEKVNQDLKAQSSRAARKTLPALVTTLLGKNSDAADQMDAAALDKTLAALSVEQRIAVKAEMARAGFIK
jgi:predicted RNase H-like nuclease (RuvC/YqgF family)